MGRCLHCDPARKNGRIQESERLPCTHGPGITCINCSKLIIALEDAHKAQNDAKILGQLEPSTPQTGPKEEELPCMHPPTAFCPKCIPTSSLNDPNDPNRLVQIDSVTGKTKTKVNFIPFKKFLADSKPQCLTRHPPEQSCPLCLPPPFPSYAFKLNCDNHRPYPAGQCTKCAPSNVNLRLQKYRHVDGITMSQLASLHMYKAWCQEERREKQRAWLLFGRVVDETAAEEDPYARRAIVSAIYQPPQQQFPENVEIDLDSPSCQNAIQFARSFFNSRPIGWMIMTNELPRDIAKYGGKALIQSAHLAHSAAYQWRFSKVLKVGANKAVEDDKDLDSYRMSEFVTVLLEQSDSIEPQAYMLSDQGMCMGRDGALIPSQKDPYLLEAPTAQKLPVPSIIYHDDQLEPGITFLPDSVLVKVRVMTGNEANYLFCHYDFPSNQTDPKFIKGFLGAHALEPWHQRVSDFNLLLALQQYLPPYLLADVCKHVRAKQPFGEELESLVSAALMEHELI